MTPGIPVECVKRGGGGSGGYGSDKEPGNEYQPGRPAAGGVMAKAAVSCSPMQRELRRLPPGLSKRPGDQVSEPFSSSWSDSPRRGADLR